MKIGICIVHYGAQELLDNCLKSLGDIGGKKIFKTEIFDCNKKNIGFTAANNVLIKKFMQYQMNELDWMRDADFDWIWLLNNDTTVPSETFQEMEKKLSALSSLVGIVGFQIRSMEEPDLIHHAGTVQCFPNGIHKSGSVKLKQFQKSTLEKWVTFASVLIRREVFEQIGLLDENMRFIGSDSDFCYRARAAGFRIIYEPTFVIYHKIGQSQKTGDDSVMRQMQQDMLYFQNKHMNGKLFFDLDRELL